LRGQFDQGVERILNPFLLIFRHHAFFAKVALVDLIKLLLEEIPRLPQQFCLLFQDDRTGLPAFNRHITAMDMNGFSSRSLTLRVSA
jgi:DNA polymerase III epsilon subunit-like protein